MKRDFLTFGFILATLLGTSCQITRQDGNERGTKISDADRIEISIIPVRSSEISFKAKTITDKNQITEICDFENGGDKDMFYKTFPSLPDGFLSFYKDSIHIQTVYFVFDSTKGYFQFLENGKQKLISQKGYNFLKRIYDDKDWLPQEIEVKE